MGAGVSAGESNDDLIDNLLEAGYIRTARVEKVFRAVDRGAYFLPDPSVNAYRDVAWKSANLHISAPCIYSEVMEGLRLEPGHSFLNLGSGTGYLNTMAGLILGAHGLNHGVELHADVVAYAHKKLDDFRRSSGALDEFDFCEPKFTVGNCLSIVGSAHQYDRVYCGAACPENYLNFVRGFVKVGGVLYAPVNDELWEMRRTGANDWAVAGKLPVAFAGLVQPPEGAHEPVNLLDAEPLSLQELCRSSIRNYLRGAVECDSPGLKEVKQSKKAKKKAKLRRKDKPKNWRRTVSDRSSDDDYYNYFFLRTRGRKNGLNRATPPPPPPPDEASSSEDSSDDSSLENKVVQLQEIFIDFMANQTLSEPLNTTTSSSSDTNAPESPKTDPKADDEDDSDSDSSREEEMAAKMAERGGKSDDLSDICSSSEDEQVSSGSVKRGGRHAERRCNSKWRRIETSNRDDSTSDCECEVGTNMNRMKMYVSPYTVHMVERIRKLPLPLMLKKYLNYYREF